MIQHTLPTFVMEALMELLIFLMCQEEQIHILLILEVEIQIMMVTSQDYQQVITL